MRLWRRVSEIAASVNWYRRLRLYRALHRFLLELASDGEFFYSLVSRQGGLWYATAYLFDQHHHVSARIWGRR